VARPILEEQDAIILNAAGKEATWSKTVNWKTPKSTRELLPSERRFLRAMQELGTWAVRVPANQPGRAYSRPVADSSPHRVATLRDLFKA
jgi:hypothetical protein